MKNSSVRVPLLSFPRDKTWAYASLQRIMSTSLFPFKIGRGVFRLLPIWRLSSRLFSDLWAFLNGEFVRRMIWFHFIFLFTYIYLSLYQFYGIYIKIIFCWKFKPKKYAFFPGKWIWPKYFRLGGTCQYHMPSSDAKVCGALPRFQYRDAMNNTSSR